MAFSLNSLQQKSPTILAALKQKNNIDKIMKIQSLLDLQDFLRTQ